MILRDQYTPFAVVFTLSTRILKRIYWKLVEVHEISKRNNTMTIETFDIQETSVLLVWNYYIWKTMKLIVGYWDP